MRRFCIMLVLSGCNLIEASHARPTSNSGNVGQSLRDAKVEDVRVDSGSPRDMKGALDVTQNRQDTSADLTVTGRPLDLNFSKGEFRNGSFEDLEGLSNEESAVLSSWRSRIIPREEFLKISTVVWYPKHLYGVELPSNGEKETLYPAGNIDMGSNSLLLHMEGSGTLLNQEIVGDASGTETHFSAEKFGLLTYDQGVFGSGIRIGRQDSLSASSLSSGLQFSDGDFSWEMWAKTSECIGENNVFMGSENQSSTSHIWMGCATSPNWCQAASGFGGAIFNGLGVGGCGARFDDDEWHHLVFVKSRKTNETKLAYYLDGLRTFTAFFSYPKNGLNFDGSFPFEIGKFPDTSKYDADFSTDEVAIYKRALSDKEIQDRYRRGTTEVKFTYKFCEQSDCLDNVFIDELILDDGKIYPRTLSIDDSGGAFFQLIVTLKGKGKAQPLISRIRLE